VKTQFDFLNTTEEGGAIYFAAHEIWSDVRITLPPGYFENFNGSGWPPAITVESFVVLPVNKEG
jgi:hypothetical protein